MSELCECTFNITWHGQVDFAFLVVPIKCDSQVASSFPVLVNFVVLLNCLDKMVDIGFVDVFDSEVIDNQCEADGLPVVFPISWCDLALAVSCLK